MRANYLFPLIVCVILGAGGCTTIKGDPYVPGEIQTQGVQMGTIVHVGASSVTQEPTVVGPLVGAGIGGLAGSLVAGGNPWGLVGGAGIGALAGGLGEMHMRRTDYGVALTIEMDSGKTIVLAQPEDDIYTVGDRVRVMRDGAGYGRVQLQ